MIKSSPKFLLFSFIFLVLTFSLVSSVATVNIQTQDDVILIEYSKIFTLKQNEDFHFSFHALNKTTGELLTNATTNCTINLRNSSGEGIFRQENMSFGVPHTANDCKNCYSVHILGGNFSDTGSYSYIIRCSDTGVGGIVSIGFEVTNTGLAPEPISNNSLMIFMLIISLVILIMGAVMRLPSMGFIGGVVLMLAGVYTMIYGVNDFTNLYTRIIAVTEIGTGFIFMLISAYEWIWGKEE